MSATNGPPSEVLTEARSGDPVALARALVSVPSVNPGLEEGGAGEHDVAVLAAELMDGWGLAVDTEEVSPGRWNVTGRLEGDGSTLLLNGHLDTVGVRGMTVPPFEARVADGRLTGRGSCDMKGGVGSLLAATRRLAAGGPRPGLTVSLVADEELASLGMSAVVDAGVEADMAVVCEPTGLAVMPAHKGFVWITATFRGRAAHGSRPDLGIDAIRHAALYLAALDGYAEALGAREAHPLLGYGSVHAGTIRGGSAVSVYPELCELVLERRTMPGEGPDDVLRELAEVLSELEAREPAVQAELDLTLERPGTEVSEDSALVRGLREAAAACGTPADVVGMTAWVDAALLNVAGVPAVCYGPGHIAQAHTADEWIELEQIVTCADVLERFARTLAG